MTHVTCPYCDQWIAVVDGRTVTHLDEYPLRVCEGSGRVVVGGVVSRASRTARKPLKIRDFHA